MLKDYEPPSLYVINITFAEGYMGVINFGEIFQNELEKFVKNIKKPNILVLGGSGVGKSTLVNLVLKREVAIPGSGKPETKGIITYPNDVITIHDSEGYESGEEKQAYYKKLIGDFIEKKSLKAEDSIHLAWYCISAPSARVNDVDIETVKLMQSKRLAVAVILTQVDATTEEACEQLKAVLRENLSNVEIFESSIDEKIPLEKGLNELNAWSLEKLPEQCRNAFICASHRDLEAKLEESKKAVNVATAAAAGIGASPIPFSDAPLLVAAQQAMLVRLAYIWDLDLKEVIASSLIDSIMSTVGKSLAGTILKFIPGLNIVGMVVNAAVAAALTYALGTTFSYTCHKICKDQIDGKVQDLASYFDKDFFDNVGKAFKEYMKGNSAEDDKGQKKA